MSTETSEPNKSVQLAPSEQTSQSEITDTKLSKTKGIATKTKASASKSKTAKAKSASKTTTKTVSSPAQKVNVIEGALAGLTAQIQNDLQAITQLEQSIAERKQSLQVSLNNLTQLQQQAEVMKSGIKRELGRGQRSIPGLSAWDSQRVQEAASTGLRTAKGAVKALVQFVDKANTTVKKWAIAKAKEVQRRNQQIARAREVQRRRNQQQRTVKAVSKIAVELPSLDTYVRKGMNFTKAFESVGLPKSAKTKTAKAPKSRRTKSKRSKGMELE